MPIHDPTPTRMSPSAPVAGFRAPSPAKLREWVRAAQPQARLVYSRGAYVDHLCPREVAQLARRLYDGGFVRLHLRRAEPGGPMEYLAVRTDRPVPAGMDL